MAILTLVQLLKLHDDLLVSCILAIVVVLFILKTLSSFFCLGFVSELPSILLQVLNLRVPNRFQDTNWETLLVPQYYLTSEKTWSVTRYLILCFHKWTLDLCDIQCKHELEPWQHMLFLYAGASFRPTASLHGGWHIFIKILSSGALLIMEIQI